MHSVWARARRGEHSAVIGATPPDPPDDRVVVRVDCEGPWSTFGPLEDARRRIELLLGDPSPQWDEALDRLGTSVLTRFLGDVEDPTIEATLVAAANRLAEQTDGEAVLVFESVDHADGPTVHGLAHIVARVGWLRLPIVVHARARTGVAGELVEQLGSDATCELAVAQSDASDPSAAFAWKTLPPDVLRVVRAASVIGRTFEADLVAALLNESATAVLERLQRAVDVGAPLADRGQGRFILPLRAPEALQARLLPSLLEHYNLRLAELLSPPPRCEPNRDVSIPTRGPDRPAAPDPSIEYGEVLAEAPEPTSDRAATHNQSPSDRPTQNVPVVAPLEPQIRIDPAPSRPGRAVHPTRSSESISSGTVHPETNRSIGRSDDARAAKHFSAAGDPEAAVDRYVEAIRKVDARGDSGRALLLADEAHALLQQLPGSPRRAVLRARVLAEAGRVQWRGAGLGPAMTLPGALETLETALAALRGEAPLELRTELASLVAGVCYDLGDVKSLERALQELTTASEAHLAAGQTEKAARLLNDQAAVYLRAGDPVRATHLLDRSREIFDSLHRTRPDDPVVIRERAETEHLLAKLPLHARLRPGRENEAFSLALGHARAAAENYERLRSPRDIARVWETMGRLEIQRHRLQPAGAHLLRALDTQRAAGDAVGLARTTAALADLYLADDKAERAVEVLGDSIGLNYDEGSPIGLAYNRRAVERLRTAIARDGELATARAFATIAEQLDRAEDVLGRIQLPGEPVSS